MPKTPSKMHMYDMVKIDIIIFEIVGGGGVKAPHRIVRCLIYRESDMVKKYKKKVYIINYVTRKISISYHVFFKIPIKNIKKLNFQEQIITSSFII